MMMVARPEPQLAFEELAVFDTEMCAALRLPFMNAAVANQFASTEQGTGIRATKELLTPGAGTDVKQAQGVLQPIEVELVAGQNFLKPYIGFFTYQFSVT